MDTPFWKFVLFCAKTWHSIEFAINAYQSILTKHDAGLKLRQLVWVWQVCEVGIKPFMPALRWAFPLLLFFKHFCNIFFKVIDDYFPNFFVSHEPQFHTEKSGSRRYYWVPEKRWLSFTKLSAGMMSIYELTFWIWFIKNSSVSCPMMLSLLRGIDPAKSFSF